jgi:hypothetical protein
MQGVVIVIGALMHCKIPLLDLVHVVAQPDEQVHGIIEGEQHFRTFHITQNNLIAFEVDLIYKHVEDVLSKPQND